MNIIKRIGAFLLASWICFAIFSCIYDLNTEGSLPLWWKSLIGVPIIICVICIFIGLIGHLFLYAINFEKIKKRYGPCPCGSGQKNKHCCGNKIWEK